MIKELSLKSNNVTDKKYDIKPGKRAETKVAEQDAEKQKENAIKVDTLSSSLKNNSGSIDCSNVEIDKAISKVEGLNCAAEAKAILERAKAYSSKELRERLVRQANKLIREETEFPEDKLRRYCVRIIKTEYGNTEFNCIGKDAFNKARQLFQEAGWQAYPTAQEGNYFRGIAIKGQDIPDLEEDALFAEDAKPDAVDDTTEAGNKETRIDYNGYIQDTSRTTGTDFSRFDVFNNVKAYEDFIDDITQAVVDETSDYKDCGFSIDIKITKN